MTRPSIHPSIHPPNHMPINLLHHRQLFSPPLLVLSTVYRDAGTISFQCKADGFWRCYPSVRPLVNAQAREVPGMLDVGSCFGILMPFVANGLRLTYDMCIPERMPFADDAAAMAEVGLAAPAACVCLLAELCSYAHTQHSCWCLCGHDRPEMLDVLKNASGTTCASSGRSSLGPACNRTFWQTCAAGHALPDHKTSKDACMLHANAVRSSSSFQLAYISLPVQTVLICHIQSPVFFDVLLSTAFSCCICRPLQDVWMDISTFFACAGAAQGACCRGGAWRRVPSQSAEAQQSPIQLVPGVDQFTIHFMLVPRHLKQIACSAQTSDRYSI